LGHLAVHGRDGKVRVAHLVGEPVNLSYQRHTGEKEKIIVVGWGLESGVINRDADLFASVAED
jgi:hypothetical protein